YDQCRIGLVLGASRDRARHLSRKDPPLPHAPRTGSHGHDKIRRPAMARRGKNPKLGEVRMVRRDGETRIIYMDNDLVRDGQGKPLLVSVFKDVTEQRRSEEHQRKMEHQLLHVQKLEAVGTLAGGIAHEINNALVPVIALTKLMA